MEAGGCWAAHESSKSSVMSAEMNAQVSMPGSWIRSAEPPGDPSSAPKTPTSTENNSSAVSPWRKNEQTDAARSVKSSELCAETTVRSERVSARALFVSPEVALLS